MGHVWWFCFFCLVLYHQRKICTRLILSISYVRFQHWHLLYYLIIKHVSSIYYLYYYLIFYYHFILLSYNKECQRRHMSVAEFLADFQFFPLKLALRLVFLLSFKRNELSFRQSIHVSSRAFFLFFISKSMFSSSSRTTYTY